MENTKLKEVVISTNASSTFNGINELEKIGFSDKALIRFGLFVAEMAGADDVVFERNFEDGKTNVFRVSSGRDVKSDIKSDGDSFTDYITGMKKC